MIPTLNSCWKRLELQIAEVIDREPVMRCCPCTKTRSLESIGCRCLSKFKCAIIGYTSSLIVRSYIYIQAQCAKTAAASSLFPLNLQARHHKMPLKALRNLELDRIQRRTVALHVQPDRRL